MIEPSIGGNDRSTQSRSHREEVRLTRLRSQPPLEAICERPSPGLRIETYACEMLDLVEQLRCLLLAPWSMPVGSFRP
jgi:hypothetical protein